MTRIPVLGNGDIWEAEDALRMMRTTGCDGVIVGPRLPRPAVAVPRPRRASSTGREPQNPPSLGGVVDVMLEHARLLAAWLGEEAPAMRAFRKHSSWYTKGFPGGAPLRQRLMQVSGLAELEEVLAPSTARSRSRPRRCACRAARPAARRRSPCPRATSTTSTTTAARRRGRGRRLGRLSDAMPERLILRNFQSAGDIVMLTAAVRDLHRCYPGRFVTDVRTSCSDLWIGNPWLTPLRDDEPGVRVIDCHYPIIHRSNQAPCHFLFGFIEYLNDVLGLRIQPTEYRGDVHLTPEERDWFARVQEARGEARPFWLFASGGSGTTRSSGGTPRATSRWSTTSAAGSTSSRSASRTTTTPPCAGPSTCAASTTPAPAGRG